MAIDAGKIMAYLDMDTSGFTSAFDTASEQLSGFTSGGIEGALSSIGAAATTAGRALTLGVTTPLLTLAGAAVGVGMGFDESMSNVYGLMSSLNLTQSQMDALRDTAREMGSTTKFSAAEAADAMGYMALAGWDDQEVIAGLPGVLDLAAAANMDLAKASDIVTDTMTPFGMAASEAARAADVFAYAQANSNTTVELLGESMKYVAPTADAFGMTLEDTAGALGVLANAGIKGSQAGTTLNAMLRDLKNNSEKGAVAIGKTKVALTNSDGSYRSYGEIIRDIDKATQGMTASQRDAALMEIFGDESLKGILATLKQGPDALDEMTSGLYGCEGAAKSMAEVMQDNLRGELTTLSSGVQEMGIALSDFLTPAIRSGVTFVTDLVGKFNALDTNVKNTIFRMGALAAAVGPVIMTGGKLLTLLSGVNPLILGAGAAAAAAYRLMPDFADVLNSGGMAIAAFGEHLFEGESIAQAFHAALYEGFGPVNAARIEGFAKKAGAAVDRFGDRVTQGMVRLRSALEEEALSIYQDWEDGGMLGALSGIGERMSERIEEALPKIDEAAMGIRDTVASGISASVTWLAPRAQTMMSNVGTALSQAKSYATDRLPQVQEAIANGLQLTQTRMSGMAHDAMTWLGEAYRSDEIQGLLGDLSGVASTIADKISVTKAALETKAGEILTSLGDALGSDEAKAKVTEITGVAAAIAGKVTSNMGAWQMTAAAMIGDLIAQLTDNGFLVTAIGNSDSGLGGIVTAIAGGLADSAVNVTSAANSIASELIGALTADNGKLVSDLFTNAGDIVGAIGSKIIESAGEITVSAESLATNLLTGLNGMDWNGIGESAGVALGDVAGDLLDAICEAAPEVAENAGPMTKAIGQGMVNAGEALGEAAGGLIDGIVTWLITGDNWERLLTAGESLGGAVLIGFGNLADGAIEGVARLIDGILEPFGSRLDEALGIDTLQSEIADKLWNINFGAPPETMAQLEEAFQAYGEAMQLGIAEQYEAAAWLANEQVVGLYATIMDVTATESERAKAYAVLTSSGYGNLIAGQLVNESEAVKTSVAEMMSGANEEVNTAIATLGGTIPGAITAGLEGGIPILEEASSRVAQIASGAKDQAATVTDAEGVAEDVTAGVSAKLDEGAPGVETSAGDVSDAVTDTLEPLPGLMEAMSKNGVLGMASAVDTNKSRVTTAMDTMSSDAMQSAAANMSASDGYSIGYDMVGGIISGVQSHSGSLYSTMTSMARTAVSRAKSALKIASPSGVFADEVGAWIPAGIGEGVERHMQDALGPLEDVRESMVGLFDGALKDVNPGAPDIPWSPGAADGNGSSMVTINVTGDWTVRSEEDKQEIIDELYALVSEELRRR